MFSSIENTCNVLKSRIDPDGRIRCSYNPGGAETHRLSSSRNAFGGGTNLQKPHKRRGGRVTIDEDIAFWTKAATEARSDGAFYLFIGIAIGLRLAKEDE